MPLSNFRPLGFRAFVALAVAAVAALSIPAGAQPANNLCSNAANLAPCTTTSGTNVGAGTEGSTSCDASSRDVFFRFVPASAGQHTITLCNTQTNWDSVLSIHVGCPATASNQLACNDDSCGLRSRIAAVALSAGTSYIIRVAGAGAAGLNAQNFDVQVCGSNPGVCCTADGMCSTSANVTDCPSGATAILGPGSCTPNPCGMGACCDPVSPGCLLTTPNQCASIGGIFAGIGIVCIDCGVGACCDGAICRLTSRNECGGANAGYAGNGTRCNPPGIWNAPCCFADYNHSGAVTVQDIFDFLANYFAGNPNTNINGAGGLTVQDIFDFLEQYFTGC